MSTSDNWYVGTKRVELSPVILRFMELLEEYRAMVIGYHEPQPRGPYAGVYPEKGYQRTVALLLLAETIADAASDD